MTPQRAAELLEAYGADPARWPEGERAAARALVAATPELRRAQAEARALDAALARWAAGPDELPGLDRAVTRVLAVLPGQEGRHRWRIPTGGAAAIAAALIGAVALRGPLHAPPAQTTAAQNAPSDAALLDAMFTPTSDEELG